MPMVLEIQMMMAKEVMMVVMEKKRTLGIQVNLGVAYGDASISQAVLNGFFHGTYI